METHKTILSAVWELADFEPLSVTIPFRGYEIIFMDAYDVRAYKVGNCIPLVVKWENITPVEALRLKRACRYILERKIIAASRLKRACRYTTNKRQFIEANERLASLVKIEETFEKSPFGC